MKIQNSNGNYHVFQYGNGTVLQSYNAIVAYVHNGVTYLDKRYYSYSQTTARHRNRFLGCSAQEFNRNVKRNRYIFIDNLERKLEEGTL